MTSPAEVGYGFVPLPKEVRRIPRAHAVFNRQAANTWSGEIDLVLVAQQPVHVGAGAKAFQGGTIVRESALIAGKPGIPGSTLKGVLRSRFEAITKSCAPSPPRKPVSVLSQTFPHIKKARLANSLVRGDQFQEIFGNGCSARGPMCPACALFGCMGLRGRLAVCDAVMDEPASFAIAEMPSQFAPRLHHVGKSGPVSDPQAHSGQILEVTKLNGRKFALGHGPVVPKAGFQKVETIPKGALVRGRLRAWCLTAEELGGLLAALGCLPQSTLKVGAGKGLGFGRMTLGAVEFRLRKPDAGKTPSDEAMWRKAFEASQDRFGEGEAALVALHSEEA